MSQHQPLQERKDSGVTWIGDIPAHWQVARIKAISTLRNSRQIELPTGALYIGLEDVESGSGSYRPTAGSSRKSDDSTVSIFRDRDVLYGKLRPYLKKAVVAQGEGACSTEFLVLDVESEGLVKPEWLHGWLLTHDVTQRIEAGCDGAKMPRASWEHVSSIPIPFPPPEEQAEILESLNGKTSRIDTLIAKKTRFIELLKEKRQAVITKAVTKGLDDSVQMRDSGEEWIGAIPKHWSSVKFNFVARVTEGLVDPKDPPYRDMVLVAPNHIESGTGRLLAQETAAEQNAESGKYTCKQGAVIYSKIRPALAKVVIAPCDCLCSADMYPMNCSENANPEWLFYLMLSAPFTAWAVLESDRVAMPKINRESLSGLRAFVPPLDEQRSIVDYVNARLARIDRLILKTERSIELLKEHRAALITAAVTGKIDVREAA